MIGSTIVSPRRSICSGINGKSAIHQFSRLSISPQHYQNAHSLKKTGVVQAVTEEDKTTENGSKMNGSKPPQELIDAVEANGDLPLEQQQTLARIYQFLVQDGNSRKGMDANITLERLLQTYQDTEGQQDMGSILHLMMILRRAYVLLWRPAELLNGRMALIGFTAGAARQYLTGETVWSQVASTGGFAYLFAYGIVLTAGFLNRQFGGPAKGIGPFTPTAELTNARAAMVGYAILAYTGYNVEITRTIVTLARQLAQSAGVPGVTL